MKLQRTGTGWLAMAAAIWTGCATGKSEGGEDSGGRDTSAFDGDTGDTGVTDEGPPRLLESGTHTLEHDGIERSFRLQVPFDVAPGAPLIVVMHGYSSSAASIQHYSGWDALAEEHGLVVAYPQGSEDGWGNAYFEVGYDFHDGQVDDVGFILALIDRVVEDQGLDADAVFATGMSNGGDMSYKLACEADHRVRAIAPIAGTMMASLAESCSPAAPVPVLEVHGTNDEITLWDGDPDNAHGWGAYLSTDDVMDHWVRHNALTAYAVEQLDDIDPRDGSTVRLHTWSNDARDTAVWLYEVEGGGHDWPGAWGNMDIHAAEVAWAFFATRL